MQSVDHILFNTVGDNFEKYLTPNDMIRFNRVSKTTRDGDMVRKFNKALEWTRQEFELFKKTNIRRTINDFFHYIPLGVIYKNAQLETGTNIFDVLDYYECDEETCFFVFMELCTLEDFKRYFNEKDRYYDNIIWDVVFQASIRLREDIVEYLFFEPKYSSAVEYFDDYYYYAITEGLRALYVKRFKDYINELMEENLMDDPMQFALIDYEHNSMDFLGTTLWLCCSFQEQDSFREYWAMSGKPIPQYIENTLNNKELKYNIYPSAISKLIHQD